MEKSKRILVFVGSALAAAFLVAAIAPDSNAADRPAPDPAPAAST